MNVAKLGHGSTPVIQETSIDALPKELIELVLLALPPKDTFSLAKTSKKYYDIISHSDTLWGPIFHKCFPNAKVNDGTLALCKELVIRQRNIKNKTYTEHILGSHEDAIKTLLVKESCLYTGSFNGVVMCWDLIDRKCIRERNYGEGLCCFEIDGDCIYTSSRDWVIRIWDMTVAEEYPQLLEGHKGTVYHLQIEGDYLCSGSMDRTIKIWDKNTGVCRHTVEDLNQHIITPFRAVENYIYIGLDNGTIRIQNVVTGKSLPSFQASENWRVNCLEVGGGCLYAGLQDNTIVILDIVTGAHLSSVDVDEGTPFSLQIEGNCLYVGLFNGMVKVLDLTTKEWLQTFKDFAIPAMRFKAVRDQLYVHSQDHRIRVLDFGS